MLRTRLAVLAACSSVLVIASLTGCGRQGGPAAAPASPPPPAVGVVTVATGEVGLVTELPGRLEASRSAQVRARAAGIVQRRMFTEGSDVKAGQVLYRIDAAPYQAANASARASLARAEASLGQASALAERYKPLVEANAISKQDYANAVAAQKQAEAEVAAARAAVRTAEINLGYAEVTAPISGRIGRSLVTEGALVGQGEATPLAVIQQINPLYVNFTQSSSEVMKLRRAFEQGQLKRAGADGAQVRVLLEDGSDYGPLGRLLFADLSVDPATGQVTIRAEIPNPRGVLLPGMFVRVQLEQAKATNAVLLPQQAVTRSPQGDTVMVVSADGKVASRPVKVGGSRNGQWVILQGLQPGEQVMVDGFQKLRPGQPVKPTPWTPAGAGATAASAAASAPVSR
ncbi:efflux RND transporter periplasmic adaptor subunit [Ramlibacter albus]|uniref:Efflux RND transporter periplasmic adaptor subunit n=1 Tax=Ramlibacter albus TaxID=2079448 RepID=A0A923M537_9BURK|nr:efflux RND transporter periplasmic adaptor subunit [Ramlibacter albus]MBC5762984.1 efflux RND transporter periplasmic adaptor subunit [Ramlibacter albus]